MSCTGIIIWGHKCSNAGCGQAGPPNQGCSTNQGQCSDCFAGGMPDPLPAGGDQAAVAGGTTVHPDAWLFRRRFGDHRFYVCQPGKTLGTLGIEADDELILVNGRRPTEKDVMASSNRTMTFDRKGHAFTVHI